MVLERCLTTLRNDFNLSDVRVINLLLGALGVLGAYLVMLYVYVIYQQRLEIFLLFSAISFYLFLVLCYVVFRVVFKVFF